MLAPPTAQLPAIRTIPSVPTDTLLTSVEFLKKLYIPEVRGSRRHRKFEHEGPLLSEEPSNITDDTYGIDDLRSDAFEKAYAIRWLTALIAQAEAWGEEEEDPLSSIAELSATQTRREALIHEAASLLAICSGTAAAGTFTRDFVIGSDEGKTSPVAVRIRDVPLDNQDYGSVGAQTWGGACVLAEMIMEELERFGISSSSKGLRILELGAGTGLVGMAVAKLVEGLGLKNFNIVLTDYYPSVLENLQYNVEANFPASPSDSVAVTAEFLDWSAFPTNPHHPPPFHEPFDLILGADIIYEAEHAEWIKSCLATLLKKPTNGEKPIFHLVIPLRSTHSAESSTVEGIFPSLDVSKHSYPADMDTEELELHILEKRTILCEAGTGLRADYVEYAYYQISWA